MAKHGWLGLFLAILIAAPGRAADRQDLGTMAPAEITALQQRLTDDNCYSGPIDGITVMGWTAPPSASGVP